jgi:hypothetical protein
MYCPDTLDSVAGVSGYISGLSGFSEFQPTSLVSIASRLLLINISYVQAMGCESAPASSGQRRQKHRHDPQIQEEEVSPPSPPPSELCPRHRPGKEPAGSSSQARPPRQAPYMMPSMAVPPPSRANPSRRGIAWKICPRTPPRLQVKYPQDQRQYPRCPSSNPT